MASKPNDRHQRSSLPSKLPSHRNSQEGSFLQELQKRNSQRMSRSSSPMIHSTCKYKDDDLICLFNTRVSQQQQQQEQMTNNYPAVTSLSEISPNHFLIFLQSLLLWLSSSNDGSNNNNKNNNTVSTPEKNTFTTTTTTTTTSRPQQSHMQKFQTMSAIEGTLRTLAQILNVSTDCLYINTSDVMNGNEKAFRSFLSFIKLKEDGERNIPSKFAFRKVSSSPSSPAITTTPTKSTTTTATTTTTTSFSITKITTLHHPPVTNSKVVMAKLSSVTKQYTVDPATSSSNQVHSKSDQSNRHTTHSSTSIPVITTSSPTSRSPSLRINTRTSSLSPNGLRTTSISGSSRTPSPPEPSDEIVYQIRVQHARHRKATVRIQENSAIAKMMRMLPKNAARTLFHPRKVFMNQDAIQSTIRENLEDITLIRQEDQDDEDFKVLQSLKDKFSNVENFKNLNALLWTAANLECTVEGKRNSSSSSSPSPVDSDHFASVFLQEESCFAITVCACLLTNADSLIAKFTSGQLPSFVGIQHLLELASYCKSQSLLPMERRRGSNNQLDVRLNEATIARPAITPPGTPKLFNDNRAKSPRPEAFNESKYTGDYSGVENIPSGGLTAVSPAALAPLLELILVERVRDNDLLLLLVPVLKLLDMFPNLVQVLHERSRNSLALHNNILWYCKVSDSKVLRALMLKLMGDLTVNSSYLKLFMQQSKLIENLTQIAGNFASNIANAKNSNARELDRREKIAQLRVVLNSDSPSSRMEGKFFAWTEIFSQKAPLTLPCMLTVPDEESTDALVTNQYDVVGFSYRNASIFKSATSPLLIPFVTSDGTEKRFIFKTGDDLRQDRNIILMFKLMDHVWKQQGLDYEISTTLYEVIPTGPTSGLMEMVPKCHPLSSVENFADFFTKHKGTASTETYVKTLAAYCVATFLLGIGDRHLDNLLITEGGHLFHIDFGFVFGDDPKPSFTTAPMRVTKNMIAHLPNPDYLYTEVCTAYINLRRYATPLLNVTWLIFGEKGTKYLLDHLRMDLDDDTASLWIRGKVTESIKSVLPSINESIHKLAQRMRD